MLKIFSGQSVKRIVLKSGLLLAVGSLVAVVTLNSCRKEEEPLKVGGCNDPDSPTNNIGSIDYDDASCLYGYITEYEITYHPEFDNAAGSGTDWDLWVNTDADLILKVKQDSASSWFFESFEHANQAHDDTARWGAPYEYKLVNTDYMWELWDGDDADPDDLICTGTFNAITNAANGYVTTTAINSAGDSSELRIKYELRPEF